jgi:hypothetical protein
MFDMINIFEVFLPQLLRYPNAADPLNGEAAALLMRDQKSYDLKVKGEPVPSQILQRSRPCSGFANNDFFLASLRVRDEICQLWSISRQ